MPCWAVMAAVRSIFLPGRRSLKARGSRLTAASYSGSSSYLIAATCQSSNWVSLTERQRSAAQRVAVDNDRDAVGIFYLHVTTAATSG
jgi:hypothetical protein